MGDAAEGGGADGSSAALPTPPRVRRPRRRTMVIVVIVAIAIAVVGVLAVMWTSEPATLPVAGSSAVGWIRGFDSIHPLPTEYQNVSGSGSQLEIAVIWQVGNPSVNWLSDIDYGENAFLVIVSAHSPGPFSSSYSITQAGLSATCNGTASSPSVTSFGSEPRNGTLWFDWTFSPQMLIASGTTAQIAVQYSLTVVPVVETGPFSTALPTVLFQYSFIQPMGT